MTLTPEVLERVEAAARAVLALDKAYEEAAVGNVLALERASRQADHQWEDVANPANVLALVAEIKALREGLEPFANLGVTSGPDDEPCSIPYRITRGSIRKARALLKEPGR